MVVRLARCQSSSIVHSYEAYYQSSTPNADGKLIEWFAYQSGKKEFYKGFICDAHRVSNRVEKLAQPQTEKAILQINP
jgi:hypothetical protein